MTTNRFQVHCKWKRIQDNLFALYNNKAAHINSSVFNKMSNYFQPSTYINVSIAEGGHILVALQMPRLFNPHPHLQNISRDLHELCKWSCAARGGAVAPFAPYQLRHCCLSVCLSVSLSLCVVLS